MSSGLSAAISSHSSIHYRLSDEEMAFFTAHGYVGPFNCFGEEIGENLANDILGKLRNFDFLAGAPRQRRKDVPGTVLSAMGGKLYGLSQELLSRCQSLFGLKGPRGLARYWYKSTHFLIPEVCSIGLSPQILHKIQSILGNDLLLWGAQIMTKQAKSHRWHADVEHMEWHGATAWLGLHNVGPGNTMKVIPGSHLYGMSPQELATREDISLDDEESLLHALRKSRPQSDIVTLDMRPGDFFIFAGRTWHASYDITEKLRTAIIFQYCHPSERVRVPENFEPPKAKFHPAQPWVMLASGEDHYNVNHVKSPPELPTQLTA